MGIALARRDGVALPPSWGIGSDTGAAGRRLGLNRAAVSRTEVDLEALVSRFIGTMPFLWLNVGDTPGALSERGFIERNAIALLSGYRDSTIDQSSPSWLGRFSDRERVHRSGLWNSNHVEEVWEPSFLDTLERQIEETAPL